MPSLGLGLDQLQQPTDVGDPPGSSAGTQPLSPESRRRPSVRARIVPEPRMACCDSSAFSRLCLASRSKKTSDLECTPLDVAKSFNQFFHVLSCLVVSAGRALGQGLPACRGVKINENRTTCWPMWPTSPGG